MITPRKIKIGKTCFADFGTPSFCFRKNPGGFEAGISGSNPVTLFCSLHISIGKISSGTAPGKSFLPDELLPLTHSL